MTGAMQLDKKEPFFELHRYDDVEIAVIELPDGNDIQSKIRRLHDQFFAQPLQERPIRFILIRSDEESFFALKCSHIAIDGFGIYAFIGFISSISSF